jgi:heptosyltransferase-2
VSSPRLAVTAEARRRADEMLAGAGVPRHGSYVVVAPGSSWRSKEWMPERFAEVARALLERGEEVVLVGGRSESAMAASIARMAPGAIDLSGETDAAGLAAVIARSSATICNDSASMHVAQAFGVPLVVIVGPTSEAQGFMPRSPRAAVVRDAGIDCRPRCRFGGLDCPLHSRTCMHNVTPAQVLAALAEVRSTVPPAAERAG